MHRLYRSTLLDKSGTELAWLRIYHLITSLSCFFTSGTCSADLNSLQPLWHGKSIQIVNSADWNASLIFRNKIKTFQLHTTVQMTNQLEFDVAVAKVFLQHNQILCKIAVIAHDSTNENHNLLKMVSNLHTEYTNNIIQIPTTKNWTLNSGEKMGSKQLIKSTHQHNEQKQ